MKFFNVYVQEERINIVVCLDLNHFVVREDEEREASFFDLPIDGEEVFYPLFCEITTGVCV